MTWRRDDSTKRTPTDPLSTGRRTPAPPRDAVPEQPMLVDEQGEPTCSVFEAMSIGSGQGFWGEDDPTRFPAELERELAREGWYSQRQWDMTRRMMFRDIEAI